MTPPAIDPATFRFVAQCLNPPVREKQQNYKALQFCKLFLMILKIGISHCQKETDWDTEVLKRIFQLNLDEVKGEWRKLCNGKRNDV
jgi:hypothetical protein